MTVVSKPTFYKETVSENKQVTISSSTIEQIKEKTPDVTNVVEEVTKKFSEITTQTIKQFDVTTKTDSNQFTMTTVDGQQITVSSNKKTGEIIIENLEVVPQEMVKPVKKVPTTASVKDMSAKILPILKNSDQMEVASVSEILKIDVLPSVAYTKYFVQMINKADEKYMVTIMEKTGAEPEIINVRPEKIKEPTSVLSTVEASTKSTRTDSNGNTIFE